MSTEKLEIEGGVSSEQDTPKTVDVSEDKIQNTVKDSANKPGPKKKMKPPLFTPEELNERNRNRLKMGKCCLKESWELYDKLVDTLKTKQKMKDALENEDCRKSLTKNAIEMCVDKTLIFRLKGLENKYKLFRQTLELLKEAPYPPFLRISHPHTLDKTGARIGLIGINKAQKPEIKVRDDHPRTIAFLGKVLEVTNTNFILPEDAKTFEKVRTQTPGSTEDVSISLDTPDKGPTSETTINIGGSVESLNLSQTSKTSLREPGSRATIGRVSFDYGATPTQSSLRESKDKVILSTKEDREDEAFELTDIPFDEDGNPIGKTVGLCCYCGKEVKPFPTPYQLSMCVNSAFFYCCKKYKELIEQTQAFEKKLQAEDEKKNAKIDISPHKKYDPKAQRLIFGWVGGDMVDGGGDNAMKDKNKSTGGDNATKDKKTDGKSVKMNK